MHTLAYQIGHARRSRNKHCGQSRAFATHSIRAAARKRITWRRSYGDGVLEVNEEQKRSFACRNNEGSLEQLARGSYSSEKWAVVVGGTGTGPRAQGTGFTQGTRKKD